MPVEVALPPRTTAPDGRPRAVGVEIEFGGPDCPAVAALVARIYGGRPVTLDPYRVEVRDTRLGDFAVELDMSASHPSGTRGLAGKVEERVRAAVGQIGSLVMPFEVAAPPVPIARLPELRPLFDGLRRLGARGTEGVLHAFGLHFNPEIASAEPARLLAQLRAFLLLEDWLRAGIGMDATRRLSPFVDRFPRRYARRVLDPAYRPDLPALIEDYVDENPSRNRGLDLFPLFAQLAPEVLFRRVADPHVRARPTWHYRLPDSRIDDPYWDFLAEWNRWVEVERLAEDPERLAAMADAYREHFDRWRAGDWAAESARWTGR